MRGKRPLRTLLVHVRAPRCVILPRQRFSIWRASRHRRRVTTGRRSDLVSCNACVLTQALDEFLAE